MPVRVDPFGDTPLAKAVRALLKTERERHGGGVYTCRGCGGWTFSMERHDEDCHVDAALKAAGYPDRASREGLATAIMHDDFAKRWSFGKYAKRSTEHG